MVLPADAHVHSEWSWDAGSDPASTRSMERTCARAVRIGLPALIFTEHLDLESAWRIDPGDIGEHADTHRGRDGYVQLPSFDLEGYLESIDRCRRAFPELRVLTGLEFGQPHLHHARAAALLHEGNFDRINGSLHTVPFPESGNGDDRTEPTTLFRYRAADDVMEAYLQEIPRMVDGSDAFETFTHIDYAVRSWPTNDVGPFDPRAFEELFRSAMRTLAGSGRALEMNTRRLWPWIPQWWAEEGGRAISFGSDAHEPLGLAAGFPEAVQMVEQFGFRAGRTSWDFWRR